MGIMYLHRTVMSGNIINLLIKLMKASFELFNLCSHEYHTKVFTPSTGTFTHQNFELKILGSSWFAMRPYKLGGQEIPRSKSLCILASASHYRRHANDLSLKSVLLFKTVAACVGGNSGWYLAMSLDKVIQNKLFEC